MLAASLKGVVAQLLMKRKDGQGRLPVNEILVSTPAVGAVIREGATQKLYDVIMGGKKDGMQFMDEAIWERLRHDQVTPFEAYMKAIDKARFKAFLPEEHAALAHSSGGAEEPKTAKPARAR
jgi:twitching motility protein PilT